MASLSATNAEDGGLKFTTEESGMDYDGCEWGDAEFEFDVTEQMKELALYPGEPDTYLYADTEGERLSIAGGPPGTTVPVRVCST